MNNAVMFSSKSAEWETPQDLFDKLNEEFHFTLDVCATPENTKCEHYYTSYRELAKSAHPDAGGDEETFLLLRANLNKCLTWLAENGRAG